MAVADYNAGVYRQARRALRGAPCWICGKPSDTVDHVPPLSSRPPGLWAGELRPACARCNYSTGGRLARMPGRSRKW